MKKHSILSLLALISIIIFSPALAGPEENFPGSPVPTKKRYSKLENNNVAETVSSPRVFSPHQPKDDMFQEAKRELRAEFQTQIDLLTSLFEDKLAAALQQQRAELEHQIDQQRVELTHQFEEELSGQRAAFKQLKEQCSELGHHASSTAEEDEQLKTAKVPAYTSANDENRNTRSDDLGALQTVVAQTTQRLDQHDADIQALQSRDQQLASRDTELQNAINSETQARGTTYVRWGSAGCSNSLELVYSGTMGGGAYNVAGAPPNYLCLTPNPTYDGESTSTGGLGLNAIYGGEYDTSVSDPKYQTTPACAVCHVPRSSSIMIPGTNQCESGWHLEYSGHLMAGEPGSSGSNEFICVDSKRDFLPGTQHNDNQNVVHLVVTACGALGCPPYQSNKIATCVVCSK